LIDFKESSRMKTLFWIVLLVLAGLAIFWGVAGLNLFEPQPPASSLVADGEKPVGFQRAESPRDWDFPKDYGPHPDYQTEWWYYTGNLKSETGELFGYQLTFFRRALLPTGDRAERLSAWAADQIYMAHFALSDIAAGEHHAFERFARGAAGLAGAQAEPYQVWLENWQVVQIAEGQYQLMAKQDGIILELILEDLKGLILHGDRGYSQNGPQTGNASYYYSQTRLLTSGTVQTANGSYEVFGLSWKDHEFSTSALAAGQVGWDWFSFHLDDGSELMVFQIRREDGSIDPFSSGTWFSPDGGKIHLDREQFAIQVGDSWRSPNSRAEYPADWSLEIPSLDLSLKVKPYLADQEVDVSYTYWEGAVEVNGIANDVAISGSGYVEMTGYAASIEGEF
jgi:predicted secreted hydrolase